MSPILISSSAERELSPALNRRLVAVTAVGVAVGEGFAEVVEVADHFDDDAVLGAAMAAARRHHFEDMR